MDIRKFYGIVTDNDKPKPNILFTLGLLGEQFDTCSTRAICGQRWLFFSLAAMREKRAPPAFTRLRTPRTRSSHNGSGLDVFDAGILVA